MGRINLGSNLQSSVWYVSYCMYHIRGYAPKLNQHNTGPCKFLDLESLISISFLFYRGVSKTKNRPTVIGIGIDLWSNSNSIACTPKHKVTLLSKREVLIQISLKKEHISKNKRKRKLKQFVQ